MSWKVSLEKIAKELFVWFVLWLFGVMFFGTLTSVTTFFPKSSWSIQRIDVYPKNIFDAIFCAVLVFYLYKLYTTVYLKHKAEILNSIGIEDNFWIEKVVPLVLIGVGWYILSGGSNISSFLFVTSSNFPFFGSFLFVLSGLIKVEPKTIFIAINIVAVVLTFLLLFSKSSFESSN